MYLMYTNISIYDVGICTAYDCVGMCMNYEGQPVVDVVVDDVDAVQLGSS